ncbi:hypothetical protein FKM82_005840 [Ascaphus truei]
MAVEAIHCNRNSNNIDHPVCTDNINLHLTGEKTDPPFKDDNTSIVTEPKGSPKKQQTEPDIAKNKTEHLIIPLRKPAQVKRIG